MKKRLVQYEKTLSAVWKNAWCIMEWRKMRIKIKEKAC